MTIIISLIAYIAFSWILEPLLIIAFKFLNLVTPNEPWVKNKKWFR